VAAPEPRQVQRRGDRLVQPDAAGRRRPGGAGVADRHPPGGGWPQDRPPPVRPGPRRQGAPDDGAADDAEEGSVRAAQVSKGRCSGPESRDRHAAAAGVRRTVGEDLAMGRVEEYRQIVRRLVEEYAGYKPSHGQIETEAIVDPNRDHYEVMHVGWDGPRR